MDAITASHLLSSPFIPRFSPLNPKPLFSIHVTHRIGIQRFSSTYRKFRGTNSFIVFSFLKTYESSKRHKGVDLKEKPNASNLNCLELEGSVLKCIVRQTLVGLFCFAIGFASLCTPRACAIAAPVATQEALDQKRNKEEKLLNSKDHQYSGYTRRLLEEVSVLLKRVEEAKKGNGDVKQVEKGLEVLKTKKAELQGEIMSGLYGELRELRRQKQELVNRSEEIIDQVEKAKKECQKLLINAGKQESRERVEKLEERLRGLEEEYSWIWKRVGEVEDQILRKETVALSYGVRELCFIERECEQLVQKFSRKISRKTDDRYVYDNDWFLHFISGFKHTYKLRACVS